MRDSNEKFKIRSKMVGKESCDLLFFIALHGMQTRSSDENSLCPSVRLSVCMSVKRVLCDKMVERSVEIFISYER